MAFPAVQTTAETAVSTAGTSHAITLPTGIVAGDLILIVTARGSVAATFNALAGWTELVDDGVANGVTVWYRLADGTEGATVTFTSSASTRSATIAYRISGTEDPATQAPQISAVTTGSSVSPDPGALTPTGGAKDYLWIAMFARSGEEADDDTWTTAAPTNYSNLLQKACGVAGTNLGGMVASAERQLNAASEDPGAFTVATGGWRAHTIAIHPTSAAPINLPLDAASAAATGTLDLAAPFIPLPLAASSAAATGSLRVYSSAYFAAVVADNPTSYFRHGESAGTVAVDEKGLHNGTYVNTPNLGATGLLTGDSDTAVSYVAASSQDCTLPSLFLTTNGTIEFWFSWTTGSVVFRDSTGAGGWIGLLVSASNVVSRVAGTDTSVIGTTASLRNGKRHHLVITKTAGDVVVYIDGVAVGSATGVANTSSSGAWHLAQNGTNLQYADCTVDEVAIYPAALGADRVAVHYSLGAQPLSLSAASAVASGSATVDAPLSGGADLPLAASSAAATGSLTLSVTPILPLYASSAVASGSAIVSVTPLLPLSASSAVASATATLSVTPILPLSSSSATATGSATLIIRPLLQLGAASAAATTGSLGLSVPGEAVISPNPSSSTATGSLTLIVRPLLLLSAGSSTATGTATVSVRPLLLFAASSGTATGSLSLIAAGPLLRVGRPDSGAVAIEYARGAIAVESSFGALEPAYATGATATRMATGIFEPVHASGIAEPVLSTGAAITEPSTGAEEVPV